MKINRNLFYFGLFLSLLIFILSFIFYKYDFEFLYNFFNNMLTSSIVLMVTSLFGYFYEKNVLIKKLQAYITNISFRFGKAKYYYENIVLYKDMCKSSKKNKVKIPAKSEYSEYVKDKKREILEYIDFYIELCDCDYHDLWTIYDDCYFIFDFNNKRKKLYEMFFCYVYYDLICEMRKHVSLLKKVKENIEYYEDAKKELEILQGYIFDIIEEDKDVEKFSKKCSMTSVSKYLNRNKELIVGNKVTFKLNEEVYKFVNNL